MQHLWLLQNDTWAHFNGINNVINILVSIPYILQMAAKNLVLKQLIVSMAFVK